MAQGRPTTRSVLVGSGDGAPGGTTLTVSLTSPVGIDTLTVPCKYYYFFERALVADDWAGSDSPVANVQNGSLGPSSWAAVLSWDWSQLISPAGVREDE